MPSGLMCNVRSLTDITANMGNRTRSSVRPAGSNRKVRLTGHPYGSLGRQPLLPFLSGELEHAPPGTANQVVHEELCHHVVLLPRIVRDPGPPTLLLVRSACPCTNTQKRGR